jgi:sugar O-acyltransferase (sialic acid O-acetyltransferase NeuD family)
MRNLIVVGAGGFCKDVIFIVERINQVAPTWNLVGFLDDNPNLTGRVIDGYTVLGTTELSARYSGAYFICAFGSPIVRKHVVEKLGNVKFATLIDPDVIISKTVSVGEGTILSSGDIIVVDVSLGKHVMVNLGCTVGHDAVLHDYATLCPGVNVSGHTELGECCEIGTGSQIIQGKKIGVNAIVGAGATVVKDIPANCTAVGCPAKPIKFHDE